MKPHQFNLAELPKNVDLIAYTIQAVLENLQDPFVEDPNFMDALQDGFFVSDTDLEMLKDQLGEIQTWVTEDDDYWWNLEDAKYFGNNPEQIQQLRDLIEKGQQYKPVDEPYVWDSEWFNLENTHEADLQALKDKLTEVQLSVPKSEDLYWSMEDGKYLGWEERKTIKDLIKQGKAYRKALKETVETTTTVENDPPIAGANPNYVPTAQKYPIGTKWDWQGTDNKMVIVGFVNHIYQYVTVSPTERNIETNVVQYQSQPGVEGWVRSGQLVPFTEWKSEVPTQFQPKYSYGEKWNSTSPPDSKLVIVGVPSEIDGLYSYLVMDKDNYRNPETISIYYVKEDQIDDWVNWEILSTYTPWADEASLRETPLMIQEIDFTTPAVIETPLPTEIPVKPTDRRRLMKGGTWVSTDSLVFKPPVGEHYIVDVTQVRTIPTHDWDYRATAWTLQQFMEESGLPQEISVGLEGHRYKNLNEFGRNFNRVFSHPPKRNPMKGFQRTLLKVPKKGGAKLGLLQGSYNHIQATLGQLGMGEALDLGIVPLVEFCQDNTGDKHFPDLDDLMIPQSYVSVQELTKTELKRMKEKNIFLQRSFDDFKLAQLDYWKDWLQNLPSDLEKIERALAQQDSVLSSDEDSDDNRPFGFNQGARAVSRDVLAEGMSPAYEPPDFEVRSFNLDDASIPPGSPRPPQVLAAEVVDQESEAVLDLQVPPDVINYKVVIMQRLQEVQMLPPDPISNIGKFSDIELNILFHAESRADWAIILPHTPDRTPFVTVGHLVKRLERKGEQSNYYAWFRDHLRVRLSPVGENYLKINLGLCALKNFPKMAFEFHNPTLRQGSYLFGEGISGSTEDYGNLEKFGWWNNKIGDPPLEATHPRPFTYIVDHKNYAWIIDSFFTYRRRLERLEEFYERVADLEDKFKDHGAALHDIAQVFTQSKDMDELDQHISHFENTEVPNAEGMGHDDDYKEAPEVKQVSPLQKESGSESEEEIDLTEEVPDLVPAIQYVPFPVIPLQYAQSVGGAPGDYYIPIAPPPKDDSLKIKLMYEFLIIGALVASRYFF